MIDDFARPDVDVALTGIMGTGGRARADLRWNDIPLANGAFRSDTAGSIEGRFYGNDHREVGGTKCCGSWSSAPADSLFHYRCVDGRERRGMANAVNDPDRSGCPTKSSCSSPKRLNTRLLVERKSRSGS